MDQAIGKRREAMGYDRDALACYIRFMNKAIRYRDASRDMSEPESVRIRRREMMKFYSRLDMTTCGGIRGSIYKLCGAA